MKDYFEVKEMCRKILKMEKYRLIWWWQTDTISGFEDYTF